MTRAPIIGWIVVVYFVVAGLSFISFLVSPFLAARKGYAPYYWLFACGPIGLIVIACLPSSKKASTPEQMELMQSRANTIGATLNGFAFLLVGIMLIALVGM